MFSIARSLLVAALLSRAAQAGNWLRTSPRGDALPDGEPPASFDRRENVVFPAGLSSERDVRPALLQTNKFYSNFLIDGPARAAWTLPYIVSVNDDHPFGMSVSYPKFFEGERSEDDRLEWYATTTTKDIVLSAVELHTNQEATLTDFDDQGFTAFVSFSSAMVDGSMKTWLVRGMAYATVMYDDFTPEVSSIHAILSVNGNAVADQTHTSSDGRFVLELNDLTTWILYSSDTSLELEYEPAVDDTPSVLRATLPMSGTLRVTRVPYEETHSQYDDAVSLLDQYSGSYPTKAELTTWMHKTNTDRGRYRIDWTTAGDGSGLLHYGLPHHQSKVRSSTAERTGIYLASPTKGDMELFTGTAWIVAENELPEFEWIPSMSGITDSTQMAWITYYLEAEIAIPLNKEEVAGGSVYFGAKYLMAYSQLCLVAAELGRDDLVDTCLDQVEQNFDEYLQHTNGNALVYDTVWGGVIGEQGLEEENGAADFYASYYNDHHFHYSYVINVAAVLAYLRPSWIDNTKVAWVNTLIRDSDAYFPQFRSFDWFSGHSWARGLLFAYDGKDQESTSEDVNFYYAMTMWGNATGNAVIEGLGRLQTGVVRRSINEYFLLKDSNQNHPDDFVKNKVTGIFFESKVDYTTWFGDNVEYIHGIQNIPVTAITEFVRDAQFCQEEWDQRLESVVESAEGTWNTVLYMSYATIQKNEAFEKMLTSGTDSGLKRAWALYWAATRPACSTYCSHDEVDLAEPPIPTPAPVVPTGAFDGVPATIPGRIEGEEFDYGGEGVGYSDTDAGNNGGQFRPSENVDISIYGDGYNVGWMRSGEYLRYTIDVTEDISDLGFSFSVSSPYTSIDERGTFRVVTGGCGCDDDDATDLSGLVTAPYTGAWGSYETVEANGGQSLATGQTGIWLCVVSAGFNLDYFDMGAEVLLFADISEDPSSVVSAQTLPPTSSLAAGNMRMAPTTSPTPTPSAEEDAPVTAVPTSTGSVAEDTELTQSTSPTPTLSAEEDAAVTSVPTSTGSVEEDTGLAQSTSPTPTLSAEEDAAVTSVPTSTGSVEEDTGLAQTTSPTPSPANEEDVEVAVTAVPISTGSVAEDTVVVDSTRSPTPTAS
ncbi:unnamed protein product, partial [Ectocarpus sp. 6 AP-2014]